MKKLTPLIILITLFVSCNKSDEFDPAVHVEIASPYLEEVLIDLGIDSDGKINGQVLKSEVEAVEEILIQISLAREVEQCKAKYDYDLINKNLLEGLENFINLRKAILILQPNFNDDKTNFENISTGDCGGEYVTWNGNDYVYNFNDDVTANIEQLNKLEELYIANHLGRGYRYLNLKISNCTNLDKIGTANPMKGIVDYPDEDFIRIDESNFFMDSPSYNEFYNFLSTDNSGEASNILGAFGGSNLKIDDLPKLESLHLYEAYFKEFEITNTPKLKKLYLFKKRFDFNNDFFLFSSALDGLEELYLDYQYYTPFPDSDERRTLDLSGFSNLNMFYYKFRVLGGERNSIPAGSILNIKNGTNLENDLKITLDYRKYKTAFQQGDSRRMAFCLDDNITDEFKGNIVIKSRFGDEGSEVVTFSCD